MFNNPVLDVAIGLVFIYLLYSLLATVIQEIIATKLAFRAKILEKAIYRMLEDGKSSNLIQNATAMFFSYNRLKDKKIAAWFYAHPLIKYLGEDSYQSKPSYLSAQNFSKVIVDLLKGCGDGVVSEVQRVNDSIKEGKIFHLPIDLVSDSRNPAIIALQSQMGNMQNGKGDPNDTEELNPDTKLFLQTIWYEAGADIDIFRQKLEQWYDDTMLRATGWYKKHVQNVLLLIGFILAISFNVDSITISKKLIQDPKLRAQLVENAGNYLEKNRQLGEQLKTTSDSVARAGLTNEFEATDKKSKELMAQAQTMIDGDIRNVNNVMGLGWSKGFLKLNDGQDWTWIFGCFITALAVSLGAPFWFDLLGKLMKIRGAGTNTSTQTNNTSSAPSISAAQSATPVSINVNTQTGMEAVG